MIVKLRRFWHWFTYRPDASPTDDLMIPRAPVEDFFLFGWLIGALVALVLIAK